MKKRCLKVDLNGPFAEEVNGEKLANIALVALRCSWPVQSALLESRASYARVCVPKGSGLDSGRVPVLIALEVIAAFKTKRHSHRVGSYVHACGNLQSVITSHLSVDGDDGR